MVPDGWYGPPGPRGGRLRHKNVSGDNFRAALPYTNLRKDFGKVELLKLECNRFRALGRLLAVPRTIRLVLVERAGGAKDYLIEA